jgi:hypothetical protein
MRLESTPPRFALSWPDSGARLQAADRAAAFRRSSGWRTRSSSELPPLRPADHDAGDPVRVRGESEAELTRWKPREYRASVLPDRLLRERHS